MFPLMKDLRYIANKQQFNLDPEAVRLLSVLGKGWGEMRNTQPILARLAQRAALLTEALDQTWRAGPRHLSYRELCLLALVLQHDLYSTNTSPSSLEESPAKNEVFNVSRLALQIYSEVVLFPLAGVYAGKRRLAVELCEALTRYKRSKSSDVDGKYTRLVLWAVVMGAVASEALELRDWYLRELNQITREENLSWNDLKTSLTQYLWWDYTFEEHTRDIWNDACSMECCLKV